MTRVSTTAEGFCGKGVVGFDRRFLGAGGSRNSRLIRSNSSVESAGSSAPPRFRSATPRSSVQSNSVTIWRLPYGSVHLPCAERRELKLTHYPHSSREKRRTT